MPTSSSQRRTVVVTGASAGVGRAIACEFARHGWNVGLVARGEVGLAATIHDVLFMSALLPQRGRANG